MNVTQTVTLVSFVLLSGFYQFAFASPRLRQFIYVSKTNNNFHGAIDECQKEEASLATLFDYEDVDVVNTVFGPWPSYWLSLTRTRVSVSTWSDGSPYLFTKSSHTEENENQICEAIVNGTWTSYDCSEKKDFMCSPGYRLIEGKKRNWCQAQQYCRTHHSDLVTITSENENNIVTGIGWNKTFWIGLMHDKWEWDKKICSTYRNWSEKFSDANNCSIYVEHDQKMQRRECSLNTQALCSNGTVRIIAVNQTLNWEGALNYCENHHTGLLWIRDEDDMKAVAQHINGTKVPGPFWIGMRQSTLFGFWIWKDSVVTVSNWENGQVPQPPMSQHCAVIQNNVNYTWTDKNCFLKHHFLCEEEVSFNDK